MKEHTKTNVVLIGMPAAGKSTVGIMLAKRMVRDFLDTDVLIQTCTKRTLQNIIDQDGLASFRHVEEQLLRCLRCDHHIIATGGSAVYYPEAMEHLCASGIVVYLDVTCKELQRRITDSNSRGIVRTAGQTFEELFQERTVLYRRYADIIIECTSLNLEQTCTAIHKQCIQKFQE